MFSTCLTSEGTYSWPTKYGKNTVDIGNFEKDDIQQSNTVYVHIMAEKINFFRKSYLTAYTNID